MLQPRTLPLPIHQPKLPDNWLCDASYGQNIAPFDCQAIVDMRWPSGDTPIHYYFRDPSPSSAIRIPKADKLSSCTVAVEPAGPRYGSEAGFPNYLSHRPNELRALAGFIIQKCAVEAGGAGGFVTLGMDAAERYVESVTNDDYDDLRNSTNGVINNGAFLTISINGADRTGFAPGDTDPLIPNYLAKYSSRLSTLFTEKLTAYQKLSAFFQLRVNRMIRGSRRIWWLPGGDPDEPPSDESTDTTQDDPDPDIEGKLMDFDPSKMTYQCEGSPGDGPNPTDCEKLSWSGLRTPETVETLQAGVPKFYSEGTCALGLSTSTSTSITWAHILAAFNVLNNLCVQTPIRATEGGHAFFSSSSLNGKRDLTGDTNSSAAIPVGINATVFKHTESGNLSTEWLSAADGNSSIGT